VALTGPAAGRQRHQIYAEIAKIARVAETPSEYAPRTVHRMVTDNPNVFLRGQNWCLFSACITPYTGANGKPV
jgi:hypothetical protein